MHYSNLFSLNYFYIYYCLNITPFQFPLNPPPFFASLKLHHCFHFTMPNLWLTAKLEEAAYGATFEQETIWNQKRERGWRRHRVVL